jgi:hypothetical protein
MSGWSILLFSDAFYGFQCWSHAPTFAARAVRSIQPDFSPIVSGRHCAVCTTEGMMVRRAASYVSACR